MIKSIEFEPPSLSQPSAQPRSAGASRSKLRAEWLGQLRSLRTRESTLVRDLQASLLPKLTFPGGAEDSGTSGEGLAMAVSQRPISTPFSWNPGRRIGKEASSICGSSTGRTAIFRPSETAGMYGFLMECSRNSTNLPLPFPIRAVSFSQSDLERLRGNVRALQQHMQKQLGAEAAPHSSNYLQLLETLLNRVESDLLLLKRKQKDTNESLLGSEKRLEAEVLAWNDRIATWDEPNCTNINVKTKPGVAPRCDAKWTSSTHGGTSIMPEVLEFDQFVRRTGGALGGWDEQGHAVFLKLRTKHQPVSHADAHTATETFLQTVAAQTGFTKQQVQAHEQWYEQFVLLQQNKKDAIQRWKLAKEQRASAPSQYPSTSSETQEAQEESQRSAADLQQQQQEEERLRKKAAIQEWKLEKQRQQQQKLEQQQEQERVAREQERQRQRLQEETRALVQEYKAIQLVLKESDSLQQKHRIPSTSSSTADPALLLRKQEHEIEMVKKKREERIQQEALARKQQHERLERVKAPILKQVLGSRKLQDKGRLLKPTAAASGRMQANDEDKLGREARNFYTPGQGSVGLRALPSSRAIPSWRKG